MMFNWCLIKYHLLVDIFLYSHDLTICYCVGIVRRNYTLVLPGSERISGRGDKMLLSLEIPVLTRENSCFCLTL